MKNSGTVKRFGPLAVAKSPRPRHLHLGFATFSLDNFSKLFNLLVSLLPVQTKQPLPPGCGLKHCLGKC